VGAANGRNPISIIVPCHRVIGADGSLTGYGWGVDRKAWLLAHERDRTSTLFPRAEFQELSPRPSR
jgi:methylated-DNA-[protein]-cysteine S-methyltransferase